MKKSALSITNLTVSYPGFSQTAVENINFSVEPGTIAALIGPNGSGKSTIIKAILGLLPYAGEIKIFDKPVSKMADKIGYVPQRFSFDQTFPLTVEEFISMVMFSDSKQRHLSVDKVLAYVVAEDLKHKRLSTLSGGQLQKVLLARALVRQPSVLLLDEPEAGVDVGGEQTFYDLMEKLVEDQEITALIASHELDVVYSYASQVICVNKVMMCSGPPSTVLNQETFEKLYGRNLKFYGHHGHQHNH